MSKTVASSPSLQIIQSQFLESDYQSALASCDALEQNSQTQLFKAKILLGMRKFSDALHKVSEAIISDANNAHLYSLQAQIFLYMGRYKESIESAIHAIDIDRDNIGAYAFKGQALKHLYLDQEAISTFREGVDAVKRINHIRDVTLDLEKAFLARSCQEYDYGIKYSKYVIESAPKFTSGYIHLGFNLLSKYIAEKNLASEATSSLLSDALIALDKALALNPHDSITLYYKGFALQIAGNIDEALTQYAHAAEISPDFSKAVIALINIHMLRKSDSTALEFVNKFLIISPNSEEALLLKVKILSSTDKLDQALETIEELIHISPENYYFFYRKALVQSAQNNFTGALETCNIALTLRPENIDILYHKAITLSDLKDHYEALDVITQIIALKPDYALAYRAKGHILSEIHEHASGFKHFYETRIEASEQSTDILDLLASNQMILAEIWYYNSITNTNKTCLESEERAQEKIDSSEPIEAEALLLEAIALNPRFIIALIKLSEIQTLIGKHEEAEKHHLMAETANPEYTVAILSHSKLPHVLTIEQEAIEAHDYAIALDPKNSILHSSKANSLSKFHIEDGLSECLERASSLIQITNIAPNLIHGPDEYPQAKIEKRAELLQEVQSLIESTKALQLHDDPSSLPHEFQEFAPSRALFSMRFASVRSLDTCGAGVKMPIMPDSPLRRASLTISPSSSEDFAASMSASGSGCGGPANFKSSPTLAQYHTTRKSSSTQSIEDFTSHIKLSLDVESIPSDPPSHTPLFPTMVLKAKDALKQSLNVATNKYATVEQMNAMISMLKSTMRENEQLRSDLEIMRHEYVRTEQVTFAIAHNTESVHHEDMLRRIESDPLLTGYYSSFVRTFQIYFAGFMARNSGVVESASAFSIPGLDYIPLPPIFDQAVHAGVNILNDILEVREDNAISRALRSAPDLFGILTSTIQKVGCELCCNPSYYTKIIHLKPKEHYGIFKLKDYYDRLKSKFFEDDTPTPQMEFGASDALKIIQALKKGLIKIEVISSDIDVVIAMSELVQGNLDHRQIIIHTRLSSVVEEGQDAGDEHSAANSVYPPSSRSSTTATGIDSARHSANPSIVSFPFSRNPTPDTSLIDVTLASDNNSEIGQLSRTSTGIAIRGPIYDAGVAVRHATAIETQPIATKHWYDCFKKCCGWTCCGSDAAQNILAQPEHVTAAMGVVGEHHDATA